MKIGIIGPTQSGKTNLFKILLSNKAISGNIGVFKCFDKRVDRIQEIFASKKASYPEFTFLDLGPTADFKKKDLSQLHDIDLFICVVGAFFSEDPKKDFENCITDVIVTDLETIQARIERLKKEKKAVDREREQGVLERCQMHISEGKMLSKAGLTKEDIGLLSGLVFLTLKPVILAINLADEFKEDKLKAISDYSESIGIKSVRFFGRTELELLDLEPWEREKFLKELGKGYNVREDVSRLILQELDLVTFFTTGDKETRGWYLKSGLPAIEAAGKIHTDMKRGFIRAEVVNWEDFVKSGSMHKAREAGVLKVEGKDYVVKDGDIINIRFNV